MLTVEVHKDVTEYKPKVIGGLTMRTLACLSAALGVAVLFGVVVTFVFRASIDDVIYLVWLPAIPAALVGFWSPHGMAFERFAPLWLDHEFGTQLLFYVSASHRAEARAEWEAEAEVGKIVIERNRNEYYERLRKRAGIEIWNPGGAELPAAGKRASAVEAFWKGDGEKVGDSE